MSTVMIPHLRSELLNTTALTSTQHKGAVAAVVGLAASVAIPFAGPGIASALVSSGFITASMGMAASIGIGALMGAGVAYATDGNVAMGAIGGGIGGGIAGYNTTFTNPNLGAGASLGSTPFAGGAPAPSGANINLGGGLTTTAATPAGAGVGQTGITLPGAPSGSGFAGAASGGATFATPTLDSLGSTLGGGGTASGFTGMANTGSGVYIPKNGFLGTSSGTNLNPVASAPTSFMDKAGNFVKSLPSKIMSSEAAQQAAGKAVTMGIGNILAGDEPNMTAEEKARMAELESARAFQKNQIDKQTDMSDGFYRQAASINPYYYGRVALTDEQNRLIRAQEAGLRKINPNSVGARSAADRRNALDKSRLGGFDRGRQEAEAKRLQYMQAAQATSPSGSGYATNIASDLAAADKRYKRKEKEVFDIASVFKPIAGEIFSSTDNSKLTENA